MTSPVWRFREKQRAEVHQDPANTEFFAQQDVAERLVREAAQNSMDAVRNGSAAELSFRFVMAPASAWPRYFGSLWPHLESQPELDGILPTAGESVPCLLIEDFGTTGLTGDLEPDTSGLRDDERSSRLFWFFKNVGRTSKTGEQLGSFGIGKTVFPDSSRINTFFGYSVREVSAGESPIVLLGQSQLREHRLPGSRDLDPFGFYCWHEGTGDSLAQRAITEAAELSDFRQAFAIHRTERETGLSVVVPYPDGNLTRESLARAVFLQFFYPILSGRLTVLIEETVHGELLIFSAETVLDAIGAVGFPEEEAESLRRRVRLAQWSLTDGPAERIDLARPANPQAPSFDPSMIGASRLLELSRTMIAGKRMAARFPVPVERKRSPLAWSHVDVFLEYERHGLGRDDMYLRQGLTLVEHTGHAKHPGLRAILVAEDPAVYELLRSSENVAHTAWRQRSAVRLLPQPEARMRGECWRIHESSNTFQLWYNRDVPQVATAIKAKDPLLLGLILPAAVREILTRTHLAGGVAVEPTEWTGYGMTVSGEPFPAGHDGEEPSRDEIEEWIDGVVSTFSTKTARFRERLLAVSEDAP